MFKYKKNNFNDIGFGEKTSRKGTRLINKDGTYNVKKIGVSSFSFSDIYHSLITISWPWFILLVCFTFFFANLPFVGLYLWFGIEEISSIQKGAFFEDFWNAFYFSSQTMTTVGFGYFAPVGTHAKIIASIEAFTGVLGFAIATGVLYGRFARPVARIKYSSNALISPYQEGNALMFRLVNLRNNQLIEVETKIILTIVNKKIEKREYYPLTLERNKINMLPLNWTVVHPIDDESPLNGLNEKQLIDMDAEIIILLKAFDESFSQTVYDKKSYRADEFVWGAKFRSIINDSSEGSIHLNIHELDKYDEVSLNMQVENS